ncbi:hypothetical protein [Anabaena sp. UHCC 0451]|nr:hypothetical protein [Anabaena sp. UHCC 0451]MEA5579036.1 hypothetical protein [Anabaena sp. UHCC 0451]
MEIQISDLQIITGNAAANTLNGKAGADIFTGGLGNDKLYLIEGRAF